MLREERLNRLRDRCCRMHVRDPAKSLFVTFSADKKYMDECKDFVEPRGVPTFPEIEQPFEVLSILYRCTKAMQRPR